MSASRVCRPRLSRSAPSARVSDTPMAVSTWLGSGMPVVQALPSPLLADRRSILDVNVVTEEAVKHKTGSANLLSSIFAPPLKLWERQA